MIDNYIKEENSYREAKNMGLVAVAADQVVGLVAIIMAITGINF